MCELWFGQSDAKVLTDHSKIAFVHRFATPTADLLKAVVNLCLDGHGWTAVKDGAVVELQKCDALQLPIRHVLERAGTRAHKEDRGLDLGVF